MALLDAATILTETAADESEAEEASSSESEDDTTEESSTEEEEEEHSDESDSNEASAVARQAGEDNATTEQAVGVVVQTTQGDATACSDDRREESASASASDGGRSGRELARAESPSHDDEGCDIAVSVSHLQDSHSVTSTGAADDLARVESQSDGGEGRDGSGDSRSEADGDGDGDGDGYGGSAALERAQATTPDFGVAPHSGSDRAGESDSPSPVHRDLPAAPQPPSPVHGTLAPARSGDVDGHVLPSRSHTPAAVASAVTPPVDAMAASHGSGANRSGTDSEEDGSDSHDSDTSGDDSDSDSDSSDSSGSSDSERDSVFSPNRMARLVLGGLGIHERIVALLHRYTAHAALVESCLDLLSRLLFRNGMCVNVCAVCKPFECGYVHPFSSLFCVLLFVLLRCFFIFLLTSASAMSHAPQMKTNGGWLQPKECPLLCPPRVGSLTTLVLSPVAVLLWPTSCVSMVSARPSPVLCSMHVL